MNSSSVRKIFEIFAKRVNVHIQYLDSRQTLIYIELQSSKMDKGRVRLCLDMEDEILIAETAIPFTCIFLKSEDMHLLLRLCMAASPAHTGKRLFPSIDMKGEHLLLSYITGSPTIRTEEDIIAVTEACIDQVLILLKDLKKVECEQKAIEQVSENTSKPCSSALSLYAQVYAARSPSN